jgi:FPC/CPF motif-containing protein YcgG
MLFCSLGHVGVSSSNLAIKAVDDAVTELSVLLSMLSLLSEYKYKDDDDGSVASIVMESDSRTISNDIISSCIAGSRFVSSER